MGFVLWGTILVIALFIALVARAASKERREGPRKHLREPVLKGWDQVAPPGQERPRS
ncbi:hypothetical protein SAMN06264364_102175 [Quadrisphaera granulorum]|uniref:Uncharacterized protein n=1 Tax=Quadrisphaera granulorum TaxID=317664 RepID=A0A316AEL9_9ACTN|nr:hypothetical protein BXY45_102175 [Quadrisphaera granulorum]SZE95306.1 hypothetical protein SAMN06264364_102175 [Quadrisphaera granulorum]